MIEDDDDDMFTVPEIKSKWNEPAPSLGSKWESSKWEKQGGGSQDNKNKEIEVG